MDAEILHTLQEIRGILYALGIAFAIGVLFWIIRSISIIINQFKETWRKDWRSRANDYFDRGAYDELIEHCEERKKGYPNDAHVYWWLARAYQQKGDAKKADRLLLKVKDIEPSWEKEFVEPYLSTGANRTSANQGFNSDAAKDAARG